MGYVAMVRCLNCGNEFPHSVLLDKAYTKQPECCDQCGHKKFSYFNISKPEENSRNNNHFNKNNKRNNNRKNNNFYNKKSNSNPINNNEEEDDDLTLSLLEIERRNHQIEIEQEIYQQELQRQYDFEQEEYLNHQKATYDYIMNDYNNNGIPDHKE